MRTSAILRLASVLILAAAAPAAATNYYYVGGPEPPGTSGDGSWQWRSSGIQDAFDWVQANGAGSDWDIRVHGGYLEDVDLGTGKIDLGPAGVTVNRARATASFTFTAAP